MIALTSSNELGLAMMFAEQCIQCSAIQQLANKIFAFAAKLNLKTSLMMQFSFQSHFIHSDGDDKPLVNQLMPRLNQDRIVDFGSRTQINYERISILVRNMPIEDRNRYGRIKDILPPVLATANAKIQLLDAAHSISEQVTHLETTVATLNNNFLNLDSLNQQHHDRAFTHLHDMLWSTTQTLGSLGLEQDQEEAILNQIEQAILKTKSTLCEQNAFIAYLQNTNETVTTITKEFSKIKQLFESQKKLDEEINEDLNDIELF